MTQPSIENQYQLKKADRMSRSSEMLGLKKVKQSEPAVAHVSNDDLQPLYRNKPRVKSSMKQRRSRVKSSTNVFDDIAPA